RTEHCPRSRQPCHDRARANDTSGRPSTDTTARPRTSAIAHRWGFSDTSHFSRSFKAAYGVPPSTWREWARDTQVQGPGTTVQGTGGDDGETGDTAAPG
ncbi:helix-turn-helix domain-containing protein, partial [Pseudonocardia sp. EV170527-09]